MIDYTNVLQIGAAILIEIAIGFVSCKLKIFNEEATLAVNRFLLKCCYLPMIARALAVKDMSSLSFMPFVVPVLTTTTCAIILGVICYFSRCFKDRMYMFTSTYLATHYINYLIIGLPIFNSLWGEEENQVLAVQNISGDCFSVPLFLVVARIYEVERENKKHKEANDGLEEKIDWHLPLSIIKGIITNNLIIGNILGFIYAATKWDMCPYLWDVMKFLGDSVLPLAMFTVGGFLSRHSIIACNFFHLLVCILIRHIIFPACTGVWCSILGLAPKVSRQVLIMTCLPTATASYLLSEVYKTGPGCASSMILWSTVLCIPAIIVWLIVLDKLHIFEYEF